MILRVAIALGLVLLLLALLHRKPRTGVPVCLGYLALVGGLRRWVEFHAGVVSNDPLLLAVPAVVFIVAMQLREWKSKSNRTELTQSTRALLVIMLIQAANPLQGSAAVGLAGLMFYVVPVLWFFIGREKVSLPLLATLFKTTVAIGIAAAIYGLKQTWYGFTPWENAWIQKMQQLGLYEALNVGSIRAFSFFTSASEYAAFLGITFVVLWAKFLTGSRLALLPTPLIALALFLESSRGIIILTLFASAVMWAVQSRTKATWVFRGTIALLVSLVGMGWLMMHLSDGEYDDRIHSLVEHQVDGLTDPFGEESTASGHVERIWKGVLYGITHPWGAGLGATTIGAGKFGGADLGTEGDFSNLFVSLGVVGGLVYSVFIFRALRVAVRLWQMTRHELCLVFLGILLVQFISWLNTGQYSTVMLIWFCMGAMDTIYAQVIAKARARILSREMTPEVAVC